MGRIAWFDGLARKRYGDVDGFHSYILTPLVKDLLSNTWMHERLNCDGTQQLNRTAQYFEYPSVVSMVVGHIVYGVELGLDEVRSVVCGLYIYSYQYANLYMFSYLS